MTEAKSGRAACAANVSAGLKAAVASAGWWSLGRSRRQSSQKQSPSSAAGRFIHPQTSLKFVCMFIKMLDNLHLNML